MQNYEYWLLPEQPTFFERVPHPLTTVTEQIHPSQSKYAVIEALKYRDTLGYLGKQGQKLKVVCIPAQQLAVHPKAEKQGQVEKQGEVPCLIKTDRVTEWKGYRSGKRSALFGLNGKMYRYKGCGNDSQGFIVNQDGLRGSHFYHTAKRELYMTNLINQLLQQEIGLMSANRPVCMHEYPSLGQFQGLANEVPLLGKYCCVFETKGDRRAGTHLISPLQILFLNILDLTDLKLQEFFKQKKRLDEYGLTELLIDFQMMLEKGQTFMEVYDSRKEFQEYVTLGQLRKTAEVKQVKDSREVVEKLAGKFSPSKKAAIVGMLKKGEWIQIIEIVLERVGWQMGQIKRIFCQNKINWGFFNDHGYFHCNSHLNNFILTKPALNARFTLPLDFDLAFLKEEFINIEKEAESYGQRDDDVFEQMLMSEYNSMEMSVSGVEIMNFRYSIEEEAKQPPQVLRMARIVFRDTLVRAFRWGMRGNKEEYARICQKWDDRLPEIDQLVHACLLLSTDFQT